VAPSCKLIFARFSARLKFQDGAECGNKQNRETQKTVIHDIDCRGNLEGEFSGEMENISNIEKRKVKKDQKVSDDDNMNNDDASGDDLDCSGGQEQTKY
jgi:hypothetical protein